jgi:hypothetical protein
VYSKSAISSDTISLCWCKVSITCGTSTRTKEELAIAYIAPNPGIPRTVPHTGARKTVSMRTLPVDDQKALVLDHVGNHEDAVRLWVWELERTLLALNVERQGARLAQLQDAPVNGHLAALAAILGGDGIPGTHPQVQVDAGADGVGHVVFAEVDDVGQRISRDGRRLDFRIGAAACAGAHGGGRGGHGGAQLVPHVGAAAGCVGDQGVIVAAGKQVVLGAREALLVLLHDRSVAAVGESTSGG